MKPNHQTWTISYYYAFAVRLGYGATTVVSGKLTVQKPKTSGESLMVSLSEGILTVTIKAKDSGCFGMISDLRVFYIACFQSTAAAHFLDHIELPDAKTPRKEACSSKKYQLVGR